MKAVARIALILALMAAAPARAQEGAAPAPPAEAQGDDAQALAQQLSNPVASLISVPLQQNFDFGIGPEDGMRATLNIQPVVPITLSDRWTLVLRTILPITAQNDVTGPDTSQFGLGDTSQSFFFTPRPGPNGLIWAVGPALLYPTSTSSRIGSGKWGAGPTVLVLKQSGRNTFGLLANHIWSIAGDDERADISATFIQPFFTHTTAGATTFSINTETSYDWIGNNWVVPINVAVSQLTSIGRQRISIGGGVRYYVERPAGGPDWGLRLTLTFLFPKG